MTVTADPYMAHCSYCLAAVRSVGIKAHLLGFHPVEYQLLKKQFSGDAATAVTKITEVFRNLSSKILNDDAFRKRFNLNDDLIAASQQQRPAPDSVVALLGDEGPPLDFVIIDEVRESGVPADSFMLGDDGECDGQRDVEESGSSHAAQEADITSQRSSDHNQRNSVDSRGSRHSREKRNSRERRSSTGRNSKDRGGSSSHRSHNRSRSPREPSERGRSGSSPSRPNRGSRSRSGSSPRRRSTERSRRHKKQRRQSLSPEVRSRLKSRVSPEEARHDEVRKILKHRSGPKKGRKRSRSPGTRAQSGSKRRRINDEETEANMDLHEPDVSSPPGRAMSVFSVAQKKIKKAKAISNAKTTRLKEAGQSGSSKSTKRRHVKPHMDLFRCLTHRSMKALCQSGVVSWSALPNLSLNRFKGRRRASTFDASKVVNSLPAAKGRRVGPKMIAALDALSKEAKNMDYEILLLQVLSADDYASSTTSSQNCSNDASDECSQFESIVHTLVEPSPAGEQPPTLNELLGEVPIKLETGLRNPMVQWTVKARGLKLPSTSQKERSDSDNHGSRSSSSHSAEASTSAAKFKARRPLVSQKQLYSDKRRKSYSKPSRNSRPVKRSSAPKGNGIPGQICVDGLPPECVLEDLKALLELYQVGFKDLEIRNQGSKRMAVLTLSNTKEVLSVCSRLNGCNMFNGWEEQTAPRFRPF